jgi:hypothetical protein
MRLQTKARVYCTQVVSFKNLKEGPSLEIQLLQSLVQCRALYMRLSKKKLDFGFEDHSDLTTFLKTTLKKPH